jgi:hypothetical protein
MRTFLAVLLVRALLLAALIGILAAATTPAFAAETTEDRLRVAR